ncbi:MAG: UDP-glucose/GDP-mannose dehydrogenase family protein [Deltaproteobacteria bacterium]|nr:UDP-glucose/GDP-mannose dehydrogenase family protein [Deltaproteobacteria bacterium]
MKVCVFGLYHTGSTVAASLASAGFSVAGLDFDGGAVKGLQGGTPPLFEPGLEELFKFAIEAEQLSFTSDPEKALDGCDLVWVTFDTPVDDRDNADVGYVTENVVKVFPYLKDGSVLLISSQLPVGTTSSLERAFCQAFPQRRVSFAYSPENLRLGSSIESFKNQARVVVGMRCVEGRDVIKRLFGPFGFPIVWMGVESAEMTKHALNAFLAASVAFINEIAAICERVGAECKDVETGLKSEPRIGKGAYLKPGGAFSGGTLARDVKFLISIAEKNGLKPGLLSSIQKSNDEHKLWAERKLSEYFGSLKGRKVTVLGLTYKPQTSTLRRSGAIGLCGRLVGMGAQVRAYDPAIRRLPPRFNSKVIVLDSSMDALLGADALVVATEWEDFKRLTADNLADSMRHPLVLDQSGFLESALKHDPRIKYITVGKAV